MSSKRTLAIPTPASRKPSTMGQSIPKPSGLPAAKPVRQSSSQQKSSVSGPSTQLGSIKPSLAPIHTSRKQFAAATTLATPKSKPAQTEASVAKEEQPSTPTTAPEQHVTFAYEEEVLDKVAASQAAAREALKHSIAVTERAQDRLSKAVVLTSPLSPARSTAGSPGFYSDCYVLDPSDRARAFAEARNRSTPLTPPSSPGHNHSLKSVSTLSNGSGVALSQLAKRPGAVHHILSDVRTWRKELREEDKDDKERVEYWADSERFLEKYERETEERQERMGKAREQGFATMTLVPRPEEQVVAEEPKEKIDLGETW